MDKLKALFGSEALTFEQLEEKLKDNKEVKLANLAAGGYVDKKKHEDIVGELSTANNTIKELQESVKKFDGVDVDGLKQQAAQLEEKYNKDTAALKLDSAVNLALVQAKVKNPKLAKAALDMSIIKLDGENLLGLTEQVEALKESDGYLFETDDPAGGAKVNTGAHHSTNNNTDNFMSAFMKGAGIEEKKEAN
jgi:hypothetical protein